MNLHKSQLYLLKQHSRSFNSKSAPCYRSPSWPLNFTCCRTD